MKQAGNRRYLQSARSPSQERRSRRLPYVFPGLPLFGQKGTDIYRMLSGFSKFASIGPFRLQTAGKRAALVESATGARAVSMRAVLDIVIIILDLYTWLLIASAILSWLIAFNVVNTRNQFVSAVAEFLYRITEPVLAPIRSIMPNLGGLDISPIIVILLIMFIERVIMCYIYPNVI